MLSIYYNEKVKVCLKQTREFYLSLTNETLQLVFEKINLENLEWFYAKNTSYLDMINHTNELFKIKYKVYKKKKYSSITEALFDGTSCSGLIDTNQIVYFQGNKNSNLNYFVCSFYIDNYLVYCEVDRVLKNIIRLISVIKTYQFSQNSSLTVTIAGDYCGERSSLQMTECHANFKVKTITSINDDMHFNKYRHKIDSTHFYEYKNGHLKRIYFIGKDGSEVNTYFNKRL